MSWLNIIKAIIECVIPFLGHIGKKNAVKDLHAVTDGIERFSKAEDAEAKGKALKTFITDTAVYHKVEDRLNKRVKKWEKTLWKKVF